MTFTLDTSGAVTFLHPAAPRGLLRHDVRWPDLSPFEQGTLWAMFASIPEYAPLSTPGCTWVYRERRFSDLAPEALDLIRRDCAAFSAVLSHPSREAGGLLWQERQAGKWHEPQIVGKTRLPAFPPLTSYLSDDGKVRLREAA